MRVVRFPRVDFRRDNAAGRRHIRVQGSLKVLAQIAGLPRKIRLWRTPLRLRVGEQEREVFFRQRNGDRGHNPKVPRRYSIAKSTPHHRRGKFILDWSALTAKENKQLEEEITGDLLCDDTRDEIEFRFDDSRGGPALPGRRRSSSFIS